MDHLGIPLGAFELLEPIGRGGMGDVWRGIHRRHGLHVAIKFVTARAARHTSYAERFADEVRAAAGLDHPHIVMVLDQGTVGPASAEASQGMLSAGAPWLAMELASGGSLRDLVPHPPSWAAFRRQLLEQLDALAHAHARGIVHLDIKPANVLLCSDRDLRPGLKLSDFGLARWMEAPPGPEGAVVAGTLHYMAPEQIEGAWRSYGPWTDLYALGCLAFEMAVGQPPFGRPGSDPMAVAYAHLQGERVPFRPRLDPPGGFEGWLDRLTQRRPDRRFACAAAAAWALLELEDPSTCVTGSFSPVLSTTVDAEPVLPATELLEPGLTTLTWRAAEEPRPGPPSRPVRLFQSPPPPGDWRRPDPGPPPPRLMDVGLAMFGVRAVPFVGRLAERDRLWAALRRVWAERGAAAVLLRGPAGAGKSRLARWLVERAAELGGAASLRAVHSPISGPDDGVAPMLRRHLRAEGLGSAEWREHVQGVIGRLGLADDLEPEELAQLLALPEAPGPALRREHRDAAWARVLERVGEGRPVLLWLDDLQWGADALRFVARLLRPARGRRSGVLVVGTIQSEALAERTEELELLGPVLASGGVDEIDVGPLEAHDARDLVQRLLRFDQPTLDHLVHRAGGNPLFAVQLATSWVERGLLEPGKVGYGLVGDGRARLPSVVSEVHDTRVAALLHCHSAAEGEALELAAVLGPVVRRDEWARVCALAGAEPSSELVEGLLARRLVRPLPGGRSVGLAFVHGMIREAIVHRARLAGRLQGHHRACAAILLQTGHSGTEARRGQHLLEAGELADAVTPLLEGARELGDQSDYRGAGSLLDLRERAVRRLGWPEEDPRVVRGHLRRAATLRAQGRYEESRPHAERACSGAQTCGDQSLLAEALLERGRVDPEIDAGIVLMERASVIARQSDLRQLGALAARTIGTWRVFKGDLAGAEPRLQQAFEEFSVLGDSRNAGFCATALSHLAKQVERVEDAARWLDVAAERFRRARFPLGLAECANERGEHHRLSGELEAAEACYRDAIRRYASLGAGDLAIAETNLGTVLVARGRRAEGRAMLRGARDQLVAQGRLDMASVPAVTMLAPAARDGDGDEWSACWLIARDGLATSGMVHLDLGLSAESAGEAAERAAEEPRGSAWRGRALDAFGLARDQYGGLGRVADAARMEARLLALAGPAQG